MCELSVFTSHRDVKPRRFFKTRPESCILQELHQTIGKFPCTTAIIKTPPWLNVLRLQRFSSLSVPLFDKSPTQKIYRWKLLKSSSGRSPKCPMLSFTDLLHQKKQLDMTSQILSGDDMDLVIILPWMSTSHVGWRGEDFISYAGYTKSF